MIDVVVRENTDKSLTTHHKVPGFTSSKFKIVKQTLSEVAHSGFIRVGNAIWCGATSS